MGYTNGTVMRVKVCNGNYLLQHISTKDYKHPGGL